MDGTDYRFTIAFFVFLVICFLIFYFYNGKQK